MLTELFNDIKFESNENNLDLVGSAGLVMSVTNYKT